MLKCKNRVSGIAVRAMACSGFFLFALCGPCSVSTVQAQTPGPEVAVNQTTFGEQGYPKVATRGAGFIVVWESSGQDGSGDAIVARRLSSTGAVIGGEFFVNSHTTGSQDTPAVDSDNSGNFVVVWESSAQDGSYDGIFAQRFTQAAAPLGTEFQVNTVTLGSQDDPDVAVDFTGDFAVVWEAENKDGDGSAVVAQRYNSSGTALGGEILVNSFTTGAQVDPAIAMDASGNFVIVWTGNNQDGSLAGVFGQRYNSSGTPLGAEFQVNTFTTGSQDEADVARDAAGAFIVTWESNGQDGSSNGVYAQRYDSSGNPVGTEFRANTVTNLSQDDVAIGYDGTGGFTISWESVGQDGGIDNGVFARSYDSGGIPFGPEFLIPLTTAGDQDDPSIALDDVGNFVIVWNSFGQDGSYGGVFSRHFEVVAISTTTMAPTTTTTTTTTTSTTTTTTTTTTSTTTTTTTTLPSVCAAVPAVGCKTSLPGAGQLRLRDKGGPKDKLKWKLTRGDQTEISEFLNPPANSSSTQRFCLYDSSGNVQPLMELGVNTAATCSGAPCWKLAGTTGYKYKDKLTSPSGVSQVRLKAGVAGKSLVQVKGKGVLMDLPNLPLTMPVTAQLIIESGGQSNCWQVEYALAIDNDGTRMKAKGP